ncbi:MAG TPA: DUF6036 family nucleotidyltransferase [Solirubrobacteraceae bacterium]|jgi:hypothetical protein|nr:DUF6036 family nucleotidyltransferase [Solirubrobacteraceae bacterium]
MRPRVDEGRLREFARALGLAARHPTRLYLTGGASAVLEGWRASTVDVDVRFEPDDDLLRALPALKERLGINVELASPPDFVPELPGWRERSKLLFSEGNVSVHHFDFYSQALSKIERSFDQDLEDVGAMISLGLVEPERLGALYDQIESELYRYPAIDPAVLREKVEAIVG